MEQQTEDNLSGKEDSGSQQTGCSSFTDIHCHCLCGIDDGPETQDESVALCRALIADGMGTVIATPHQLGRFSQCNENERIRNAVSSLNLELESRNIDLTVLAGADVRVDERICELFDSDRILTLADGGKYLLLELPHGIFIDIEPLLMELSDMDIQVIISHPERHSTLARQPKILFKWVQYSAHFQITAGSLIGGFGILPQKAAWFLLSSGIARLVATDSHDLKGRKPCMRDAFEQISIKLGRNIAREVCIENPLRIIRGQDIVDKGVREISREKPGKVRSDEKLPSRF